MHISPSIRSFFLTFVAVVISAAAFGQIGISITIGPPSLPVYEQPLCPGEGYLWTPGYWAYDYDVSDYYWVPGTWVEAPEVGFLWTPGYWGWGNGRFVFNEGYWGPHVGFYGGISYGFGYSGEGYEGGRWDNGRFFYNRSVNNVNITNIHNVYNTTVINNMTIINRVSYNGGNGGINARPRPEDEIAARERHVPPVAVQAQHVRAARSNPQLRAATSQGRPPIAATARPGAFNERDVVPAKETGSSPDQPNVEQPRANETPRPGNNLSAAPMGTHARELQPHSVPPPTNGNNSGKDQKYQQQQEKLSAKQNQEHDALAQKQEQEHQRLTQQNANQARQQQAEQQHQQQTQRLEQNHAQQKQKLQSRGKPPSQNEPQLR
jgi:hypothetical protein